MLPMLAKTDPIDTDIKWTIEMPVYIAELDLMNDVKLMYTFWPNWFRRVITRLLLGWRYKKVI